MVVDDGLQQRSPHFLVLGVHVSSSLSRRTSLQTPTRPEAEEGELPLVSPVSACSRSPVNLFELLCGERSADSESPAGTWDRFPPLKTQLRGGN